MTGARHIRRAAFWTISALLLLAIVLAGLSVSLPRLLASIILPAVAENAGIENLSVHVRHVGFHSADIGPLSTGSGRQRVLLLDSMQLSYSPRALLRGHIESIVLRGIEWSCEYRNGEFILHGIDLKSILGSRQEKADGRGTTDREPTLSIGRIEVQQSTVSLTWRGYHLRLPVRLEVIPASGTWQSVDIACRLFPRDQAIAVSAAIDIPGKTGRLTLNARDIHPDAFSDLLGAIPGLAASGSMDMEGRVQIGLTPFRILSGSVSARVRKGRIKYGSLQLTTESGSGETHRPFVAAISGEGKEWSFSAADIAGITPIPFHIPQWTTEITLADGGLSLAGDGALIIDSAAVKVPGPLRIPEPIVLPVGHSAAYSRNNGWSFSLVSNGQGHPPAPDSRIRFTWGGVAVTARQPRIRLYASGNGDASRGEYSLALLDARAAGGGASMAIPQLTVNGHGDLSRLSPPFGGQLTFRLSAENTRMTTESTNVYLPHLLLDGRYGGPEGPGGGLLGRLSFSDAEVSDSARQTVLGGIDGAIPLAWPIRRPMEKGTLSIGHMRWRDSEIGSLVAGFEQNQDGFLVDGKHTSSLLPGLTAAVKGSAGKGWKDQWFAEVDLRVVRYRLPSGTTLEKILPAAKDIAFSGTWDADLKVRMGGSGISGTLDTSVSDAAVTLREGNVTIEGIQASLSLPDLPNLRSAPKQQLRFREASFGNLRATDGMVDYQIESPGSFFVEKSSLGWSSGRLHTHAVRIRPGDGSYGLTVYCDRLSLAELLGQIGSVKAEGEGTVNGRIPLQFIEGKLRFTDGFLYSTPGNGGKLRLTETDILTAGIPPDTPQFTQLEVAREALRDYDYSWVKLNLETEEDVLFVGMQLDGKPADPMPFEYRKDLGGFARIEAGGDGSIFQGIRLDVNLRVPLERILRYGDVLTDVLDN